mgnify:CR=1 FL=1
MYKWWFDFSRNLKNIKKIWKKVLTFFDKGVKIINVPSNRQKYLKIIHKKLVKSKNKTIVKTSNTSFLFCLKNRVKNILKIF